MAAIHGTAVAKAMLSATLLRADPTPVSGDEISRLHILLDKCIHICSPDNIKTCKHWILNHVVVSNQRITAFGKYLVALSTDYKKRVAEPMSPSSRRRRLHILYLLNDIIHHTTFYSSPAIPFGKVVEPFIKTLFSLAQDPTRKKQKERLLDLISIWQEKGYYSESLFSELKQEVANSFKEEIHADSAADAESANATKKERQVLLPALHGDPSAPYHDLPATTMLPLMRPNSPTPLNPRSIQPIPMKAGPPPKVLADAVDSFLKNVDKMWYGGDMREPADVDELGIEITKPSEDDYDMIDEVDDIRDGVDTYYGWTKGFAVKMMARLSGDSDKRDRKGREDSRGRSYSRSLSRSRSRSLSRPGLGRAASRSRSRSAVRSGGRSRKKRYSRSHSRSRSRSRSRDRSESRRGSRSRSRHRSSRRRRRRTSSRSYSRSRSRSRSHTRRRLKSRSRSSRSRSGSSPAYSPKMANPIPADKRPPPPPPSHHQQPHAPQQPPPPPPPPPGGPQQFPFNPQFPMPMPTPEAMAQFFQAGIPPPPPMGPGGGQQWPMNMPYNNNNMQVPSGNGGYGNWNQQGQMDMSGMYGQGQSPPGGNHGYNNRGGFQRGRGGWNNNRGRGW